MKNELLERGEELLRIQCTRSRPTDLLPVVPVITGPTASGKTDFSLSLSERVKTLGTLEIVSADAFQIFRGMDLGTAKPDKTIQARLPHHLIDIRSPSESYNVGIFITDTVRVLESAIAERKPIAVCGGTGLYIQSLMQGLNEAPSADTGLRDENRSRKELLEMLQAVDPESAVKMERSPLPRLVRAVEITSWAGTTLREWRSREKKRSPFHFELIELSLDRAELYRRIERRVDEMMERGLVAEVEELRAHGITPEMPSQRAIGYREVHRFLDGEYDRDRTIELIKRNTRRYAKRQLTWWRHHG